jgi:hypothetical protein
MLIQNPYVEEEQTTQWPKEKVQKDKQRSTKHTHKTKDLMHCQKIKLVRSTSVLFMKETTISFKNKNNAGQANTPVLKQPLLLLRTMQK